MSYESIRFFCARIENMKHLKYMHGRIGPFYRSKNIVWNSGDRKRNICSSSCCRSCSSSGSGSSGSGGSTKEAINDLIATWPAGHAVARFDSGKWDTQRGPHSVGCDEVVLGACNFRCMLWHVWDGKRARNANSKKYALWRNSLQDTTENAPRLWDFTSCEKTIPPTAFHDDVYGCLWAERVGACGFRSPEGEDSCIEKR